MVDPAKDVDGLTPVNAGLLSLGRPGLPSQGRRSFCRPS